MISRSELYNYLKILLRDGFSFDEKTQTVKAVKKFTDDDIDSITCIVANYFGDKIREYHTTDDFKKENFKFSSRWINIDENTIKYGKDGRLYVDTEGLINREEIINSIIESPAFVDKMEQIFVRRDIPFIQNTGEEYIDLGITADEHTKVIVDFMPISSESGVYSLIGDATEENKGYTLSIPTEGSFEQNKFGNCSYQLENIEMLVNRWHTAELSPEGIFLDNTALFPFHLIDHFESKNLMLFKIPGFDEDKLNSIVRIARVRIWHHNELIMDLKPAVENEKACFVNRLDDSFYKSEIGELAIG